MLKALLLIEIYTYISIKNTSVAKGEFESSLPYRKSHGLAGISLVLFISLLSLNLGLDSQTCVHSEETNEALNEQVTLGGQCDHSLSRGTRLRRKILIRVLRSRREYGFLERWTCGMKLVKSVTDQEVFC